MSANDRFAVPPAQLVNARLLSHAAVQWASRAARANLEAALDDSHSNLGWSVEHTALLSHEMGADSRYQIGFSFATASLLWLVDGQSVDTLPIADNSDKAAGLWCDTHLMAVDLKPTGEAIMPYALDAVEYAQLTSDGIAAELACLGAWYAWTQAQLERLVNVHGAKAVSPPTIRCWPHHFDIATLFSLEGGDAEHAKSIGVGLSPGDGSYVQPYLYCNPWPVPGSLPPAAQPMHWHTDGFTSLVCPASRLEAAGDGVLSDAFELCLGIVQ
jgi:hypothetical protein